MLASPLLAVRADGGPGIGVGHLARSLALVQAWRDRHGAAALVSREIPSFWSDLFLAEGCSIADPDHPPPAATWWAIDGYHLGGARSAPHGSTVLLIDDRDGAGTHGEGTELVVDHNLGVDPTVYPAAREALTGPRYALLRRELSDVPVSTGVPAVARRVVVVLGGSPTPEVRALGEAVAADDRLGDVDVRVLRGGDDVVAALADADLAFAAAGTVSWELCTRGVPAVLVSVAPNQDTVARELSNIGAATQVAPQLEAVVDALTALVYDADRRRDMASVGRSLVDGLGARRVVCRLRSKLLALREVTPLDAEVLFEWSNDRTTRAASFSSEPITWTDHVAWLRARLTQVSAASYIASDLRGHDVGLIRFDERSGGTTEVGVTVAPSRRGQGWGGALVQAGCQRFARGRPSAHIVARIKPGNEASVRAFVDADFDPLTSNDAAVLQYARHLDGDERST